MPYCSQCGQRAGEHDAFCAQCGAPQPADRGATASASHPDPFAAISPRTLSILCYLPVVGWIAAVFVLGGRRFRQDLTLRFHAFQGLYIFAAWLLVDWAIDPFFSSLPHHVFRLDKLLQGILFVVWIFMIIKTSQGETYSLPILGELAQRSARER